LPRAAHFHLRTIEIFRIAGIGDEVRRQSYNEFLPDGAIVAMDSLAGKKLADIIPSLNIGVEAVSPCERLFVGQPGLERILKDQAKVAGADVLEGHEIVGVDQDTDGVTATIRDVETGEEHRRRAKYLIGADGAHSKVRELLGIPMDGRGVFSNSVTIYFTADLWPQLGNKPLSVVYINNPVCSGFFRLEKHCQSGFLGINMVGTPDTNPDVANAAGDITEPTLIKYVRAAAGVPDLDVKIDGVARWRATSDVARRYQDGRAFLVGDAAHLMPPNGGFGGNTGIHDAFNLAWKLAYVLKGVAAPALLDTYETERRPIGKFTVEQAYSRYVTRTATYLEAKDFEPVVDDFNIELGHVFHSPAVISENGGKEIHDDPHVTKGRPGTRGPHVWLERSGKRVSSIDLYGPHYTLVAGREGSGWCAAGKAAAAGFDGLTLETEQIGGATLADPDGAFLDAYGISPSGAALIRPDGVVAWRAEVLFDDPQGTLGAVLGRTLLKT
jgi:2-polyprenyl-6-methoxyphenol hydroxylase-like FAD-dependent oxidoreductase